MDDTAEYVSSTPGVLLFTGVLCCDFCMSPVQGSPPVHPSKPSHCIWVLAACVHIW